MKENPLLERGDTVLHDRGINDGETISCLKRDLGVDVTFGLKKDQLSYRYAVGQAVVRPACRWERHPEREEQEITRVKGIGEGTLWETLTVPINGCVVREPDEREADGYKYYVFGSTNEALTARGIIGQWVMDEFHSTKRVEILFHVLMVLIAYNLCQVYGRTEAGARFAGKTKRARQRELRREGTRRVVVIAGSYYAVLEELEVAEVLLEVEGEAKERLRGTIQRLREDRIARK
jgi:hypothetical protein